MRSRHWIGACPDPDGGEPSTLRMKLTEIEPGQFDGKPHEPFEIACFMGDSNHDGHTLYPCTAEEYTADDDDGDA